MTLGPAWLPPLLQADADEAPLEASEWEGAELVQDRGWALPVPLGDPPPRRASSSMPTFGAPLGTSGFGANPKSGSPARGGKWGERRVIYIRRQAGAPRSAPSGGAGGRARHLRKV